MSEGIEAARQTTPREDPWLALVKLCATIALLVILLRSADLRTIFDRLRAMDSSYALAAVVVGMIQIAVAGFRWRYIVSAVKTTDDDLFSLAQCLQITWAAQAVSQFTPMMAGDAIRVLLLRETGSTLRTSFKSVLLDRGFGLAALLALTTASLLLAPQILSASPYAWLIELIAGIGLVGTILQCAFAPQIGVLGALWPTVEVATDAILDMRRLFLSLRQATTIVWLCLIVHSMSAIVLALLVRSQALQINASHRFTHVSLGRGAFCICRLGRARRTCRDSLQHYWHHSRGFSFALVSFGTVILVSSLPGGALFLLPVCSTTRQDEA